MESAAVYALFAAGLTGLGQAAVADVIGLNDKGLEAIRTQNIVTPRSHADGSGWVIEGQIFVPRDETGQPTLKYPAKYIQFRPLKGGPGKPVWGSPKDDVLLE